MLNYYLVKQMLEINDKITLNHIVEVFRGSSTKSMRSKGFEAVNLKACGEHYAKLDAERLVRRLVELEILKETTVLSGMGFPVSYTTLNTHHPNTTKLLNKQLPVVLTFSEKKRATPKPKPQKKSNQDTIAGADELLYGKLNLLRKRVSCE